MSRLPAAVFLAVIAAVAETYAAAVVLEGIAWAVRRVRGIA